VLCAAHTRMAMVRAVVVGPSKEEMSRVRNFLKDLHEMLRPKLSNQQTFICGSKGPNLYV
jgi:hypothetical protein